MRQCRLPVAVAVLLLLSATSLPAQTRLNLPTTPERTRYEETSKYEDVMTFLRAVDRASNLIRLDSMGKTFENRTMPLAIVGTVNGTGPEAVRASGKLRAEHRVRAVRPAAGRARAGRLRRRQRPAGGAGHG